MAEDHRRVEPRQIAGSGMATDPERIQRIADDAARHARAWRPPAEVGFGDVLGKAQPRGELADEPPPRERPPEATDIAPASTTAPSTTTTPATTTPAAPARLLRTTPRAPDPRQRALLQRLEQALPPTTKAAPAPAPAPTTETPPTGTAAPKRTPR